MEALRVVDSHQKARERTLSLLNERIALVYSGGSPKINDVSIDSRNLGFAVGDNGLILKFDGSSWSQVSSPTSLNLTAIDMKTSLASGDYGGFITCHGYQILRYNKTTGSWETGPSPEDIWEPPYLFSNFFKGIDIINPDNSVIVCGYDIKWIPPIECPVIFKWDGISWERVLRVESEGMSAISFLGAAHDMFGNYWVCGEIPLFTSSPLLYKSVDGGTNWERINLENKISENLNAISFSTKSDYGFAVGNNGEMIKITPSTNKIEKIASNMPDNLMDVKFIGDIAYIVGNEGGVLYFDGMDFILIESGTGIPFSGVSGIEKNIIYAATDDNEIYRLFSNTRQASMVMSEITPLGEWYKERKVFDSGIPGIGTSDTSIFNSSKFKNTTFHLINKTGRDVTAKVKGNRINSLNGAVDIGSPFKIGFLGDRTLTIKKDGWLPFYYLQVTTDVPFISNIVNGTFDTDLSGWTVVPSMSPYGNYDVIWDNGRARIRVQNLYFWLSSRVNFEQNFIINGTRLGFNLDLSAYGFYVGFYELIVEGNIVADDYFPVGTYSIMLDVSNYFNKQAKIVFGVGVAIGEAFLWVDNVNLYEGNLQIYALGRN